jgi:OmpA-OmpF porin, OOP family
MRKWKILLYLMCVGLLSACALKQANLPNDAGNLSAKIGQGYVLKVDNAVFVLDSSSSMDKAYQDTQKFSIARNLLLRMNAGIAGLKLNAGLHVVGPIMGPKRQDSKLVYGMKAYDATEFAAAANAVKPDGITPLAKPFKEGVEYLKDTKGRIAVIMISDGKDNNKYDPVKAAAELKSAFGDRICIYTVQVGDDPRGKAILDGIAQSGGCGFATTAAALSSGSELASFLEKVFLEKAPAPAAVVPPPPPAPVPAPAPVPLPVVKERVVLRGINFDFDKSVIKPEFMPVLDVAVDILKGRPDIKVVIEGHTCNIGTDAYNQGLSERRARSVYNYLVQKGVSTNMLSTIGLGEKQPMADNKTKSGRELNRRVEFKIMQ